MRISKWSVFLLFCVLGACSSKPTASGVAKTEKSTPRLPAQEISGDFFQKVFAKDNLEAALPGGIYKIKDMKKVEQALKKLLAAGSCDNDIEGWFEDNLPLAPCKIKRPALKAGLGSQKGLI